MTDKCITASPAEAQAMARFPLPPAASGRVFEVDASRFQFFFRFFLAPQMHQHLSAQVVNVGALGIELDRRIDLHQRLRIFLLPLINLRQTKVRIHQPRIAPQRFAITLLGVRVLLHQPVDVCRVRRSSGPDRARPRRLSGIRRARVRSPASSSRSAQG